MKRYAFLLLAACLFATVSVSAQNQPPGKVLTATENQPTSAIIAHVDDINVVNIQTDFISSNPKCQEMAFAEASPAIRNFRTTECAADADYGSCSSAAVVNKNIYPNKLFAFATTIYHSSGGIPL